MEIVLSSIADKGDITNERVGFKVLKDCQLKYFMVFKTHKTEAGFYNRSTNSFWFVPKEVKTGDKVVLYTRTGLDSVVNNADGTKTYFVYWGLNEPIFKNENDRIVLASINTWKVIS